MKNPLKPEPKPFVLVALALIAVSGLCACSSTPAPPQAVLVPIDVSTRSTIPQARLSWYPDAPETPGPGSLTFGVEMEYTRATGQSDQTVNANEFISLGGKNLMGPQEVRHRAELRYGHLGLSGIKRFSGIASRLELEWLAGFGETQLDLRSESRTSTTGALAAKYGFGGAALGVGPRWNFTSALAIEGRLQILSFWPFSKDEFVYPEIALRYRPAKNVAVRAGYSRQDYTPSKVGDDSPLRVSIRGPFLGLHLIF